MGRLHSAQQQLGDKRESVGRARAAWVNLQSATERVQATRQAVTTAEVADAARKAVKAGSARLQMCCRSCTKYQSAT